MNNALTLDDPTVMTERRTTDASQLKFPLPLVAAIVGTALTMSGGFYLGLGGMRSDVRDILTRMELQSKIDEAEKKNREIQAASMQDDINEMKRRLEMVQLQYQALRETMLTNGKAK